MARHGVAVAYARNAAGRAMSPRQSLVRDVRSQLMADTEQLVGHYQQRRAPDAAGLGGCLGGQGCLSCLTQQIVPISVCKVSAQAHRSHDITSFWCGVKYRAGTKKRTGMTSTSTKVRNCSGRYSDLTNVYQGTARKSILNNLWADAGEAASSTIAWHRDGLKSRGESRYADPIHTPAVWSS